MTRGTQILQLRAMIANDLHVITHVAAQITGEDEPLEPLTAADPRHGQLCNRLGELIRRVQRRRAALETLSRPTSDVADAHAPDVAQAAAPSLSHV